MESSLSWKIRPSAESGADVLGPTTASTTTDVCSSFDYPGSGSFPRVASENNPSAFQIRASQMDCQQHEDQTSGTVGHHCAEVLTGISLRILSPRVAGARIAPALKTELIRHCRNWAEADEMQCARQPISTLRVSFAHPYPVCLYLFLRLPIPNRQGNAENPSMIVCTRCGYSEIGWQLFEL